MSTRAASLLFNKSCNAKFRPSKIYISYIVTLLTSAYKIDISEFLNRRNSTGAGNQCNNCQYIPTDIYVQQEKPLQKWTDNDPLLLNMRKIKEGFPSGSL